MFAIFAIRSIYKGITIYPPIAFRTFLQHSPVLHHQPTSCVFTSAYRLVRSILPWFCRSSILRVNHYYKRSSCRLFHIYIESNMEDKYPLLLKLVALSVRIADRAGTVVRNVMSGGNLGIVDKVSN